MKNLTKIQLKNTILCANTKYRVKFKKHFKEQINQFIHLSFVAYKAYKTIQANDEHRKIIIDGFIHNAIQNTISAFNIFISGYIVAPGNLMRQYHESVAWGILCSTNRLPYCNKIKQIWKTAKENQIEKFHTLNDNLKFSKGLGYVKDNLDIFNKVEETSWKKFIKIRNFYHNLSHSSLIGISTNAVMDAKGEIVLGAYFDTGKIKHYREEIISMINAVEILPNIIEGINQQIKEENI